MKELIISLIAIETRTSDDDDAINQMINKLD
jgi:hypothetical protein